VPKNDTHKDYMRYAEHCLNMVAATTDQESRSIRRDMAAERLRLADVVRRLVSPSKCKWNDARSAGALISLTCGSCCCDRSKARRQSCFALCSYDKTTSILMENELDLLKQLKGAGERGRTIRTFDTRLRLDRLVKAGYVASQATGLELVHYRITKHGESALSDASRLI
jgi:hypothetical protein